MYDYLVIGAGATGMCFVDVILRNSEKTVILVDKNKTPGGHWSDPYSYVKLHQNCHTYGIESISLDKEDGFSVKKHFEKALAQFKKSSNFSCLFETTIDMENIKIPYKKLVDARYLEVKRLPVKWGMETPWTIQPQQKKHVVVGGGKTGMDTCIMLLKQNIEVFWVISNDAYLLKREHIKNLGNIPKSVFCSKIINYFIQKVLNPTFALSLDNRIFSLTDNPTRHRCAIIKNSELELIKKVSFVREGYVTKRFNNTLVFSNGKEIDFGDAIFIDCVQNGLPDKLPTPIFQKNKIVLQPIVTCQTCFSATTIAKIELSGIKIDLIPIKHPKTVEDGVYGYSESMINLASLYNCEIKKDILNSRLNQYLY
jgi:hypothetical protein